MAQQLPTPCGQCGRTVTTDDEWVVGHTKPRISHPHLTFEPSNWRIEHRACSDASAQAVVQANAARNALRAAGINPDFFDGPTSTPPPPGPVSLPAIRDGLAIPEQLAWNRDRLAAFDWLRPLLDVPDDASPPLAMTAPHPDAVGSYGAEAIAFVEGLERKRLRWWQRLAITRQLEHDADGRLVWRVVVESASRRSGKSVRVRGLALWRMTFGPQLFGERQEVVHTGSDLAVCRKAQKEAWRWSRSQGFTVTQGNGKEAIETPEGDTWLVRAQAATYGWDTTLGMVDEAWDVSPDTVADGLEPSLMERQSSQLHLTSTAHRRATSLMRRRISAALAGDDGETLLLLWAAAPGSDPSSEETWRAASPHWTEDRRRMIASKYEKALQGEVDPQADDLDPMAGFTAQYLNQWVLTPVAAVAGSPVVDEDDWSALSEQPGDAQPEAVSVKGWPGEGLSVARAWRQGERVVVAAEDVSTVAAAAALTKVWQCSPVLVGASLADDPAWSGVNVQSETMAARTAVADLAGLLRDGALRHDGGQHLTGQVLSLRTSPGADGLRLRSTGRADAVKAAVWAAQAARRAPKPRFRIY